MERINQLGVQGKLDTGNAEKSLKLYGISFIWLCVNQLAGAQEDTVLQEIKHELQTGFLKDHIQRWNANEVNFSRDELMRRQ